MRLRGSPTISHVGPTAQKEIQLNFSSLEVFLATTEHILKTIESIDKGQDEYAQLSRITTAFAIAIKDGINNKNVAFGKDSTKLTELCSIFVEIDLFLSQTAATTWLKRLKDRKTMQATIGKFIEQLEGEAELLLQISPELLLLQESIGASKSDGVVLFPGSGKKLEQHKQTIHNMIAISVTKGMRDLSHKIQISKRTPATQGVDCVIWSGKMDNNSLVAVKHILTGSGTDRKGPISAFLHEAHIWFDAQHHENVLPLLGIAQVGNSIAFISPWMEEGNLGEYIKTHSESNIYQLLADVARGLAYLHSIGIVYNNLRMNSVLVSDVGRAYLFSFAAAISQRQDHNLLGFLTNQSPKWWNSSVPHQNVHGHYSTTSGKREWCSLLNSDVFSFGSLIFDTVFESRTSDNRASSLHSPITSHDDHLHSMGGLDDNLGSLVQNCWQVTSADKSTMSEVACLMVAISEEHLAISNPALLQSSKPTQNLRDISEEIDKISQHPIAGGGYSDLYVGERMGIEKVALKLIRFFSSMGPDMEATRRRFRSEASLWSQFHHPHILEFYGVCTNGNGALFMVTPFLENGTVLEYLAKINPEADRVALLSQAAEGLLYLHSRDPPVLHGDMKASNVLITSTGKAVLADFGLSKLSHEMTTTMLQGVGSPRWMAPELVAVGENITGPVKTTKSDVYAYGHVILEILSNKLPFFHLKEDVHVIVELLRQGRSPRPNGFIAEIWLNDSAWAFSRDCTAVDPDERPKIEAVVSQLYRLRDNVPIG